MHKYILKNCLTQAIFIMKIFSYELTHQVQRLARSYFAKTVNFLGRIINNIFIES